MAKKKPQKFGTSVLADPTMKKLMIEHFIPGWIDGLEGAIVFWKNRLERLKRELASVRPTGAEITIKLEGHMKPIVYKAKGLIRLPGRGLMTFAEYRKEFGRSPITGEPEEKHGKKKV